MDELRNSRNSTIQFELDDGLDILPKNIQKYSSMTNNRVVIQTNIPTQTLSTLTSWALENKVDLQNLTVKAQSLEDIFLESVKEKK